MEGKFLLLLLLASCGVSDALQMVCNFEVTGEAKAFVITVRFYITGGTLPANSAVKVHFGAGLSSIVTVSFPIHW